MIEISLPAKIGLVIIGIVLAYIILRVFSKGIFTSYFEAKKQHTQMKGKKDETN